jgi:hypothetical protein
MSPVLYSKLQTQFFFFKGVIFTLLTAIGYGSEEAGLQEY